MIKMVSRKIIINKILEQIKTPKSISEIARNAGSNWKTAKSFLYFLQDCNLVENFKEKNRMMFKIKKTYSENEYQSYQKEIDEKVEMLKIYIRYLAIENKEDKSLLLDIYRSIENIFGGNE